jgi:hypothetical protein
MSNARKPAFPAQSGVSWGIRPNAGLPGWRRSADRTGLHANSLLSGNLTGNFAISGLSRPIFSKKPLRCSHFSPNSLRKLTGKIFQGTGNFLQVSGNSGSRNVSRRVNGHCRFHWYSTGLNLKLGQCQIKLGHSLNQTRPPQKHNAVQAEYNRLPALVRPEAPEIPPT